MHAGTIVQNQNGGTGAALVSLAAVLCLVTQGALRDETKNGCEGD